MISSYDIFRARVKVKHPVGCIFISTGTKDEQINAGGNDAAQAVAGSVRAVPLRVALGG
ncbi:MAG: hypothetical protein WBM09_04170 [Gallionella sp.]